VKRGGGSISRFPWPKLVAKRAQRSGLRRPARRHTQSCLPPRLTRQPTLSPGSGLTSPSTIKYRFVASRARRASDEGDGVVYALGRRVV
jgi:hypothetical protein